MPYTNIGRLLLFLLCLLAGSLLLSSCSDEPLTDEEQLRALIEQAEVQAEERKTGALLDSVADSFVGRQRYDKEQLEKLLRLYFFRHQNIYLLTRVHEVQLTAADHAMVTVFVAMAGTALADISAIARLRADVVRFDLEFIKDEEWLLSAANWQRATPEDLR